jgi:flagellin
MVINTNIPSLNGQRNLYTSSKALAKSLERLSSGLRINRGGDDPAGLAISEGLRSQVRGLNQAVRNANDGISLIQTADGAIDTYTQIVQRIRELAIQASSDVNSDDNRRSLQLEIDEQIKELNRIATTMDFNGLPLFDGTFVNKRIQVGAKSNQTLMVSVGDLRTSVIGGVAQTIGVAVDATQLSVGDVTINGVSIGSSASASAVDKAAAINAAYYSTKVFAKVEFAQIAATAAVTAGALNLTDSLTINGIRVPREGTLTVTANDSTGALVRAINAVSADTNVTASLSATNALVLTSTTNDVFTYNVSTAAASAILHLPGVVATTLTVNGRIRLYSDQAFDVAGATAAVKIGIAAGAYGLDANSVASTLNVTTFDKAQDTIFKVDNALRQINDVRAGLGAVSNRLDNTVSNLMIVSENLSASDSRVRDADFAAETSAMTRAQILQQAGVAVLAQANLTPQAALNLLK